MLITAVSHRYDFGFCLSVHVGDYSRLRWVLRSLPRRTFQIADILQVSMSLAGCIWCWCGQVKLTLLNYIHGLVSIMSADLLTNTSDTRLAVSRFITWASEPKSPEVRKVMCHFNSSLHLVINLLGSKVTWCHRCYWFIVVFRKCCFWHYKQLITWVALSSTLLVLNPVTWSTLGSTACPQCSVQDSVISLGVVGEQIFGDESFHAVTCTGTDNLTRTTKRQNTTEQKIISIIRVALVNSTECTQRKPKLR